MTHYYKDVLEHCDKQIRLRSNLKAIIFASFPSETLSYTVISSSLQKLKTSIFANVTISTGTNFTLQTSVKKLRAITMCSTTNPDFPFDQRNMKLIGKGFCPKYLGSNIFFVCTKTFYNLLVEATINVLNASPGVTCARLTLNNKQFRFSWCVGTGFTFFKKTQNQLKMILGICFDSKWKQKSCFHFSQKKCTFYDCEKCKACSHVLDIPFREQKPTKSFFHGDTHNILEEKRVLTRKKRKKFPLLEKFLRQSQSSKHEILPKIAKFILFMAQSCRHFIGW